MCGISGYLDGTNSINIDTLMRMTSIIKHRGPDDEGYCLFGKEQVLHAGGKDTISTLRDKLLPISVAAWQSQFFLGFGHRRLSILDLSETGHQPMERNGRYITYNGEIYNYLELKVTLEQAGHFFSSKSDAEVLLAAYEEWGIDCVHHLNGMWAFAIYDSVSGQLFLSRDRFGIKPLYYYRNQNKLLFSSEIKQLLEDPQVPRLVNKERMASHLFYNFREYDETTFFQDIYQLRGGHNALIKLSPDTSCIADFNIWRYYDIRDVKENFSIDNPAELIGKELIRAVRWRLRSDVKVGSCLSGGLDSSSIVALSCQQLERMGQNSFQFETVTTFYEGHPEIDETQFSRMVVKHCGCRDNYATPSVEGLEKTIEKIIWHQDEPPPAFSMAQWSVFETAARKGCKVLLDGQGGDESLAGYERYYAFYLIDVMKTKGPVVFWRQLSHCAQSAAMSKKRLLGYVLYFNSPFLRNIRLTKQKKRYITPKLLQFLKKVELRKMLVSRSALQSQQQDLLQGSLPGILHWADRNSMAFSLETRLPFLDYKYMEAALSIPVVDKLGEGYTKLPLRKFMEDKLPYEVVWRRNKFGFPEPAAEWVYGLNRQRILDLLEHPRSAQFFKIDRLKQEYLAGKVNTKIFTQFINVELWMRIYKLEVK